MERLNYKKCRENVFLLLENSRIISRNEIGKALGFFSIDFYYVKPYLKFHNFLNHTRELAYKEFSKAIGKKIFTSNIIFFREILNKGKGSIHEFVQFCEIERIPLLYYIRQIKKYIFPNEILLNPILTKLFLFSMKGLIRTLKRGEVFGFHKTIDEIITNILPIHKEEDLEKESVQFLIAFIRKNYIYGENKEQMLERLGYNEELKRANKEIEKHLYGISNLEWWIDDLK